VLSYCELIWKNLERKKSISKIQRTIVRYAGITSPKTSREGKYEEEQIFFWYLLKTLYEK